MFKEINFVEIFNGNGKEEFLEFRVILPKDS